MTRITAALLISTIALAGCGRLGDSAWSPSGWFSGSSARKAPTLEPEGGYPTVVADGRQPIMQILSARLEDQPGGQLLVVTGLAPTKGWHDAELLPENDQNEALRRVQPDLDRILRLRFVAAPPPAGSFEASAPANPAVDSITVALPISNLTLSRSRQILVSGANQTLTLR
ncbi:MAG: hypothetical protein Q4G24_13045 [Paracoccus sp. (in: a-proteobacteria)]|uniref:hypothetical protein n=1 Tax=Paracoccus sp. TaxID=267 RepID=UPI0026E0BC2A|nr:hypothetical protein [Paracoccus sp. (in: a-proteobacteria)]MDO5622386.1 hypothetical protein [Paracoccus sp. (in: a-proteobacteria)]